METIILYAAYTDQLSYYDDWIDAFKEHLDATAVNVRKQDILNSDIQKADLIVLHHSLTADTLRYLKPLVSFLQNRRGKLLSFVGNELNLPTIGMKDKIQILKDIEPEIIATQLLEETGKWLYSDCTSSKVVSIPHALNTKYFKKDIPLGFRKIDLGTRTAKYGIYIGDNDRNNLLDLISQNTMGLKIDIDNQSRFNRVEWASFLNSCKATLSTEAGSYYLEKDDKTICAILEYIKSKDARLALPTDNGFIASVSDFFPTNVKCFIKKVLSPFFMEKHKMGENFESSEILSLFFKEKCPFYSKAISSRHFDAIGTHTLNVMYEGRYNDILVPYEHYFPLEKDHSNMKELVNLLSNHKEMQKITDNVYEHVIMNHTYERRCEKIKNIIW